MFLVNKGLSCFIAEKQSEFGGHIVCGEAVQDWVIDQLGVDKSDIVSSHIKKVNFRIGDKTYSFKVSGIAVINKSNLIKSLMEEVVSNGGMAMASTRFVGFRRDSGGFVSTFLHRGREFQVWSEFIVAADGATSKLCDGLNCGGYRRKVHGVNALVEHGALGVDEMDFFPEPNSSGYGWVFYRGGKTANIGACSERLEDMKAQFDKILANYDNASILSYGMKIIPVGMRRKLAENGVIAVGDAGSFVEPLSYAGIWGAVTSARFAAEAIASYYQNHRITRQKATSIYVNKIRKKFKRRFQIAEMGEELFASMDEKDWLEFFDIIGDMYPEGEIHDLDAWKLIRNFAFNAKFRRFITGKLGNVALKAIQKALSG